MVSIATELRTMMQVAREEHTIDRQIVVVSRERDLTLGDLLGYMADMAERIERLEGLRGNQVIYQQAKAEKDPG